MKWGVRALSCASSAQWSGVGSAEGDSSLSSSESMRAACLAAGPFGLFSLYYGRIGVYKSVRKVVGLNTRTHPVSECTYQSTVLNRAEDDLILPERCY